MFFENCLIFQIMPTTVDRSSGASTAENVKPEDKGIFPGPMSHLATDTEMETVKELPAETKTLGVGSDEEDRGNSCFSGEKSKTRYPRRRSRRKLFYEENVTKDDDFICKKKRLLHLHRCRCVYFIILNYFHFITL